MAISDQSWNSALSRAIPWLLRLARRGRPAWLRQQFDTWDVVQITLLEAHEKRGQFNGSSELQLLAWLRPILVHRLIDKIRQCKNRGEVPFEKVVGESTVQLRTELVAAGTSPSQTLVRRETLEQICRALDGLPEDQRLVVELHHLYGLKLSEIAALLERTVGAVASLLHRGIGNLREPLKGLVA